MFKKLKEKIADAKLHYGVGFEMAVNDFSVKLNSVFVDHEFFNDDFFDDIEEKLMELLQIGREFGLKIIGTLFMSRRPKEACGLLRKMLMMLSPSHGKLL